MLIDACIFDQEYDMLECRMCVLDPCVDVFIVVEADLTFSGTPKSHTSPITWGTRFRRFQGKLIVFRVRLENSDPSESASWNREAAQRNAVAAACPGAQPDDVIMLSDVDEIPSREAVNAIKQPGVTFPLVCLQETFFYTLRNRREECGSTLWRGSVISTVAQLREHGAEEMRSGRSAWPAIPQAGWHLTSFGGVEQVRHKLQSFSHHVECNRPEFTGDDHLRECIRAGSDPRGEHALKIHETELNFFPEYFLEAAQASGLLEAVTA